MMSFARLPRLAFVALAVACVGAATGVAGQIFVSDWSSGNVGEWTTSGSSTNP